MAKHQNPGSNSTLDDSYQDDDLTNEGIVKATAPQATGATQMDSNDPSKKAHVRVTDVNVQVTETPEKMTKVKVAPRKSVQHPDADNGVYVPGNVFQVPEKEAARLKKLGFVVDHTEDVPQEPDDFVVTEDMSGGKANPVSVTRAN